MRKSSRGFVAGAALATLALLAAACSSGSTSSTSSPSGPTVAGWQGLVAPRQKAPHGVYRIMLGAVTRAVNRLPAEML